MSSDNDPGAKTTKNTVVVLVAIEPSNTAIIKCCLELLKIKKLANYHFHVSAVTENEEILMNLIALRELHHRLFFHNTDVRCDESVKNTVQEVVRIEGKIDILGMFESHCFVNQDMLDYHFKVSKMILKQIYQTFYLCFPTNF